MFKKYDAYKDSGVDWIGDIPAHWETKKIKHVTTKIGSGITPSGGGDSYLDEGIPFLRSQNIHFDGIDLNDVVFISLATHSKMQNSQVLKGDVLLNITGGSIGRCYFIDSTDEMNVNQHVCIVRPNKLISTYYLNSLLASEVGQKQIWYFQQGGGREGLNFQALKNFIIPCPNKEEQLKIQNFLEISISKVNQAIAIKEQQIALLSERKQIVIQTAVTQGLDPNVPMKDSGVEWIGQIPEHWDVSRVKHLGKILNGFAFPSESFTDKGVRVLKISNIQTMNLDWQDESFIDQKWMKISTNALVYEGDLVFALTRPIISTGLKATLIDSNETMLLNQRNAVLRQNKKVIKEWLYFVLLADGFIQEFEKKIDITGQQPNISTISIGNLPLVYPTLDEQLKICNALKLSCQEIDKAIEVEKNSIEKLKEYKTTLINDAVTGKIKVV